MGFCGKRLHDRSKKNAAPNVFFPACNVRIEARAGSPWFFLRGRGCGKALNYKGICYGKSKRTEVLRIQAGDPAGNSGLFEFLRVRNPTWREISALAAGEKKPERLARV
jgi:hypothetical protein